MRAAAAWLAAALLLGAGAAHATPSVWARARDPEAAARAALVAQAEALELEHDHRLSPRRRRPPSARDVQALAERYLRPAAALLEAAGAARSPDPFVRARLAQLYAQLGKPAEAAALYTGVAVSDAPAPLRARAWSALAVACAHLGRHDDEIEAYSRALALQPLPPERARILANRAEAYMLRGDVERAVAGYRASLALYFVGNQLFQGGTTTLWGLAVALDRSGDLDGGLEAVRLARTYDPQDLQINGPNWFYVPEYDRHWYEALGHWAVARHADLDSVRVEAYARAAASLREFVARAGQADPWLTLAQDRLRRCEKERAAFAAQQKAKAKR